MEEPLIPPNSSRGTQNKVAIPLPSINQTTTKRQENAGGKTLVDVRYHPTAVDVLASRLNGPVLEKLFAAHIIGPDGTASKAKPRRMVKSKMYTVLNPRSRQWKAICFKWSISLVIVFDFVIFVVSTEPVYRLQGRYAQSFHAAEGVTSTIFLLEYLARLYTITESKRFGPHGPINGRLFFMIQLSSLVDVLATLPFFLELVTGWELPQLTFLRTFRLLRILKTSGFVHATDAVWRVLYYNRQIMYMSVFVGLFMILTTATLMFYLRPRQQMKSDDFESLLSTMYLSTLILTGASSVGDLPELPWYTKCVVLLTSAFSIGMFAIPISMLTWGVEAEAARCAKRQRRLAKRKLTKGHSSFQSSSSDDYSTDEEYQRIIANEGSDDENDPTNQAILQFMQADADGSGSVSFKEYIEMTRNNQNREFPGFPAKLGHSLSLRLDDLEAKVDAIAEKMDKLFDHLVTTRNVPDNEADYR